MAPILICLLAAGGPLTAAQWQVELHGTRLDAEVRFTDDGCDSAVARLVPAPGGRLPDVELIDVELEASDVLPAEQQAASWVSFGRPVTAAGLELVPLVVNRAAPAGGGHARCRGLRLRLSYPLRPAQAGAGNVMSGLMNVLLGLGEGGYDAQRPGYLIIVPDDFYDHILPLASWREQKGFEVWVRKTSETGATREEIRDYILEAYETWDPVPSYVLLVGAVSEIPAFITGGTPCVTDHPYACVDGDDFMADLFVGRLPAANASELDVIVAKIRGYEMSPDMTDPAWFTRALMVGTSYQEGGTPAVTALMTKRIIRERLLERGFTQVDTVFYPPTRYGNGPVDTAVNRGVSLINGRGWGNYDGWGYPQYLTNDVYGLSNGWKLPVVTSIYCGTGNYARNPCFGEAWLRAGTPSEPKGAVAFWGSSWTGTSTRWNNCMDYGIYQALLVSGLTTCGPAMYCGKLAQYDNFPLPDDSFDLRVYFHVYNLLGDPALEMWTTVPRVLHVEHAATYPVGSSAFEVRVLDAGGMPVANARVCLSSSQVQQVACSDQSGMTRFAVATSVADTMLVTVTGRNLLTYQGTCIGQSAGVFVGHHAHDPQAVRPAAVVPLAVTLRNYGGSQTAADVSAVLRSADSCSVVTDSVRGYGDIAPGGTAVAPAFQVTIAPPCTSGQRVPFELAVTAGDSAWESAFLVEVSGPTLKATGTTVHSVSGYLNPGESAELSVAVANSGDLAAGNVAATLVSLNPAAISVLDSVGAYGTIAPGDTTGNTGDRFRVSASAGIGVGRRFSLRVRLSGDGGFVQEWDFPLTVGQPSAAAALGPDRYGYYAYDNTDAGCSERPVYDWVEIDPAHGGPGARLAIGNDTATTISLPFTFRFYGRDYDEVSVSDNGYVVMGSTWLGEIYNWRLPSPNGLGGLVAAFWDDFRPDTLGASGVFGWFDETDHRYIVEWSRCVHNHGYRPAVPAEQQTFEVLLFDPAHSVTATGDGPVVVQYLTVQNDDSVTGNSHNFASVGLQSPDRLDGLEYTFAGSYPDAAAAVEPGRAIRLTTNPPDTFTSVGDGPGRHATGGRIRVSPVPARASLSILLPPAAGNGQIEIVDALGRVVRHLTFEPGGTRELRWDLTDENGRSVGSGVYYVRRADLPGGSATARALVVTARGG